MFHFGGKEMLVHERLGDVFRGKCTYLRKKKGKHVKFDVKFRNLESMTKNRSSEILADEKTYFLGKSHRKVSLAKFFLKIFLTVYKIF